MEAKKSRSAWKRWMLVIIGLGVAAEVLGFAFLSWQEGRACAHGCVVEARRQIFVGWEERAAALRPEDEGESAEQGKRPAWVDQMLEDQAVHPFLGFVDHPESYRRAGKPTPPSQAQDFGFLGNTGPLLFRPREDRVVVVFLGGSVARQVSDRGRRWLEEALAAQPRFSGKEMKVISLAVGGYKAPQPAFSLAYMLLHGFHADVAILLDGLNDISISAKDNIAYGVHHLYPRSWGQRIEELTHDDALLRGEIRILGYQRRALARKAEAFPFRYSLVAGAVWRGLDRRLDRWLEQRFDNFEGLESAGGYAAKGPPSEPLTPRRFALETSQVWERSSRVLQGIAEAHNIEFHHFLQPNQYDKRKPLLKYEKAKAYAEGSPFRVRVELAYPMLRERGEQLRAEGIRFHDLSGVFEGVNESIYVDFCCHVNDCGIQRMAAAIAQTVGATDQPGE